MTALIQDRDKRNGALATLLFHILALILFILFGLKQPIPLPKDVGVEMMMADYGFTETGGGDVESESTEEVLEDTNPEPTPTEATATPVVTEEVVTQEESDVSVPESTEEPVDETPAEPTLNSELQNMLNDWNKPSDNSEGPDDGPGNSGIEEGKPEGMGTMNIGDGISYSLGGRGNLKGPDIIKEHTEEGKVVLNIYVDQHGKVIRTTPFLAGSTTTSQALFNLADKMAKSARFESDPNGRPEQKGKMTFVFVLGG